MSRHEVLRHQTPCGHRIVDGTCAGLVQPRAEPSPI